MFVYVGSTIEFANPEGTLVGVVNKRVKDHNGVTVLKITWANGMPGWERQSDVLKHASKITEPSGHATTARTQ